MSLGEIVGTTVLLPFGLFVSTSPTSIVGTTANEGVSYAEVTIGDSFGVFVVTSFRPTAGIKIADQQLE